MEPELIARENIHFVWPLIGPRLGHALESIEFAEATLPEILQQLQTGKAQLWIGPGAEMIAVTRIVSIGEFRRLIVDHIEGKNHEQYTEQMEYIEHWAVSHGATQAEAELRPGLERIARKNGWKKRRVKMFKHLNQGLH